MEYAEQTARRENREKDAEREAGGIGKSAPALQQPEYAQIIERLPVAAYAVDMLGRLTYFNRAAAELAGREPKVGSDKWCVTWKLFQADGTPLPHDECPMALTVKERREIRGVEAIVERPDGGRLWVEPFPTLLFDVDGKLTGAVNVLIDITERKRASEILREADRQKDRFLAQVSHELRNPLSAIQNSILALLRRATNPAAQLSIISRQANNLARLIDDLLDISRIKHGKIILKKERADLADVLECAVETARPSIDARSHRLKLELSAEPISLNGDPVRLSQAFANLLSNAAKFCRAPSTLSVTATREGDEAVIAVADEGDGIPEEMLPRVFDLFAQAGPGPAASLDGLGIGLALVRNLVELHGGTVSARSDGVGKGSTFIVRLPAPSPGASNEGL